MSESFGADYSVNVHSDIWPVALDGEYTTAIYDYLVKDGIPNDGALKIIENAARTLSNCPDPNNTSNCKKTGIVIGKVQSGKTSNFIALTALSFDNGYDITVVLGGTKKILVTQNTGRICDYFEDKKNVLVLDTVDYIGELTSKKILHHIRHGKKIIIVVLKTPAQIKFIRENVFDDSSLTDKPILIIDDEGDEASLNTLIEKGDKSSTYKAIESLKSILNRHCFVSVTATPQANLLINTLDILSPDFGFLMDPGKGYCGLDVFHSENTYIKKIPDNESSLLDEGIPDSFRHALSMFFVACAIYKNRGMKPDEKMSMLIHPSQKKADHKAVYNKVYRLIDDWISFTSDKNDLRYAQVKRELVDAYNEYAETTVKQIPPFENIEDDIIQAINYCGKHKINGDSVFKNADKFYDYNIYVGGTLLGRGVTLKGLTITYIIRTAKGAGTVDTVQQRARWFGYKGKYLDLCRVFAVSKILNEFNHIREHEEDLWNTVREANLQGQDFKSIARIFVLSDDMRMTRTNVAKTDKYIFTPWNKQRVFQNDSSYIQSNINILSTFKETHKESITVQTFGTGAPYSIIRSKYSIVFNKILYNFIFPTEGNFNKALLSKLKNLLDNKSIDPDIDVIWMRDQKGNTSKHNIRDDLSIPNYSVGRRPQDTSLPVIYKGDDYQFKDENAMQLQIHMIEDRKTGIISPTLSLYLPSLVISKLTNLVIRS